MKAISFWQPWGSLVVLGAKKIETRSWPTKYRGPLLIHAAKRKDVEELIWLFSHWQFMWALQPLGLTMGAGFSRNIEKMPFGALLGTVTLTDCRPTESFTVGELDGLRGEPGKQYSERAFGNFAPGRFGWVFDTPHMFPEPIPYKGHQGFFDVDLGGLE